MNTILYLFILLCFLGVTFQRSKTLTVIIFFFIWTLSWTKQQPDYINYEMMYNHESAKDIGFYLISKMSKEWGWDYYTFRRFILAVGWMIYGWFTLKFAKRCSFVAVMYLLSSIFFFDAVQNRNFLGFSFCLLGIAALITDNSYKGLFKYCLLVMVGISFHFANCFFLIFMLINNRIREFSKGKLVIIIFAVIAIYYGLLDTASQDKMDTYTNREVSTLSRILLCLLFIFNWCFIYYAKKFKISKKEECSLSRLQMTMSSSESEVVFYFNIALFALLPLVFSSLNAMRIYRYMLLVNCCFVSNRLMPKSKLSYLFHTLLIMLYTGSFALVAYYMHSTTFLDVVLPAFNSNNFY